VTPISHAGEPPLRLQMGRLRSSGHEGAGAGRPHTCRRDARAPRRPRSVTRLWVFRGACGCRAEPSFRRSRKFDARTGERTVAVEGVTDGTRAAIGLKYDKGRDLLFVAGGPTGKAFVYDASDGTLVKEIVLTPAPPGPTFINDVVLSKNWAYFIDSQQPTIYAVNRETFELKAIPLLGYTPVSGFNNNGIVASPNGKWLIVVQTAAEKLWRVDARTGESTEIDLGGYDLANGDGLLRKSAKKLYVVQNQNNQIAVFKLSKRYTQARHTATLTDPDFDVPTTIARSNGELYAVNARFNVPPAERASAEYWVERVDRKKGKRQK
jgi:sugar lactone lactonase YvrE